MDTGIIAFCGSKGAGKSTSYEIFKELYSGPIEEVALAGHLKEVCSEVFGLEMKLFIDPSLKEVELEDYITIHPENVQHIYELFLIKDYEYDNHVRPHIGQVFETPRKLLQYVGTEILHPIDPLIHSKIALKKKDPSKLTIVTDLRFVAEFDFLQNELKNEFIPVYVKNSKAELAAQTDTHPSETQLKLFRDKCKLLKNETSLQELRSRLKILVDSKFKVS